MNLAPVVEAIVRKRRGVPPERAVLVAISGIDASGKGYAAARLAAELQGRGLRVATIGIDGWLHLPPVRFGNEDPSGHFYRHAFRFDEMFEALVTPLRDRRSVRLEADYTEETATAYRRHVYAFEDVDAILLEGIYLLRPGFRRHYDLAVWIDCTFETAIERAVSRGQEGLSPEATVRAFRTIYLPAQEVHFERDHPREAADWIVVNDLRLETSSRSSASNA